MSGDIGIYCIENKINNKKYIVNEIIIFFLNIFNILTV
jgi:hypothetical protein